MDRLLPTPLVPVQLNAFEPTIWCKLEFLNPSGSTKDRIANFILSKALRQGRIIPGDVVIEASSGSTSISMAMACAQFGLKFIAVMPEGVSNERFLIIRSYGGEVLFTDQSDGIAGAIKEADRLADERRAFWPRQFSNTDNSDAHRLTTAQEIISEIPLGQVDAVVSGVGTGGTLVGLYQGLSENGCKALPVAAKPIGNMAVRDVECCSFSTRIPGVVDGLSKIFAEANLPGLIEVEVEDEDAVEATRGLIRKGFPIGPSSGLNYCAAIKCARSLQENATVVTVFPDRMERYFSTELFDNLSQSAD